MDYDIYIVINDHEVSIPTEFNVLSDNGFEAGSFCLIIYRWSCVWNILCFCVDILKIGYYNLNQVVNYA